MGGDRDWSHFWRIICFQFTKKVKHSQNVIFQFILKYALSLVLPIFTCPKKEQKWQGQVKGAVSVHNLYISQYILYHSLCIIASVCWKYRCLIQTYWLVLVVISLSISLILLCDGNTALSMYLIHYHFICRFTCRIGGRLFVHTSHRQWLLAVGCQGSNPTFGSFPACQSPAVSLPNSILYSKRSKINPSDWLNLILYTVVWWK